MNKTPYFVIILFLATLNIIVYSCNQSSSSETAINDSTSALKDTPEISDNENADTPDEGESTSDSENNTDTTDGTEGESNSENKEEDIQASADVEKAQKPATHSDKNEATIKKAVSKPKVRPKPPKKETKPPKPAPPKERATMTFTKKTHEFGTIIMGDKVEHSFTFTNNGKIPLIVSDASATCGCTVPEIPSAPIAPGETGSIKVVFDSTGKIGSQTKDITIHSNAGTAKLLMKGMVITENLAPKKSMEPTTPVPPPGYKKDTPASTDTTSSAGGNFEN